MLVCSDDGLKATEATAAALCPCPSLFLLFFSSLPLFLLSPASSAPSFANVPCQSLAASVPPFLLFLPLSGKRRQRRVGDNSASVADMIYEDAQNAERKLAKATITGTRARARAVVAWYWFFRSVEKG